MSTERPLLALWALTSALFVAGCGGGTDTNVACDPVCPASSTCTAGTCVPNMGGDDQGVPEDMAGGCVPACSGATPWCNAGHLCVPCLSDDHCPIGNVCKPSGKSALCVPGCNDDSRCARPDGGASSMKCCGGMCLDTATDPMNCGGCGKPCSGVHSATVCTAGACVPGACQTGWGDCNNDPTDGCEANLHVDPMNCTACGMACTIANSIGGCSDGCYVKACKFGYDDCNGDLKDGCETSVLTDPKNCGGCGQPCAAVPHAKNACSNAACQLTGCDQGFADCDANAANGCETTVATDVKNCGMCGNACPQGLACVNGGCTCPQCNIPNSKTKCINLQCVFDSCVPGFADCNNNTADGCEVNLTSDGKNCTACGMVCPQNAPNCINSMCMSGFTHHDGFNNTWVDNIPTGTFTQPQAAMACTVYVKALYGGNDQCILNGCGCGGQDVCVYNQNMNPRRTWFYNNGAMGGLVTNNCCGCGGNKWD